MTAQLIKLGLILARLLFGFHTLLVLVKHFVFLKFAVSVAQRFTGDAYLLFLGLGGQLELFAAMDDRISICSVEETSYFRPGGSRALFVDHLFFKSFQGGFQIVQFFKTRAQFTATFINGPFIDPDEGRHTLNHDLTSKRPRPAVPVQRRG